MTSESERRARRAAAARRRRAEAAARAGRDGKHGGVRPGAGPPRKDARVLFHDITIAPDTGRVRSARAHRTDQLERDAVDIFADDVRQDSTRVTGLPDIDATWRRAGTAATCSLSHNGIPVLMMTMLGPDDDLDLLRSAPLAGAGMIDLADARLAPRPLLVCIPLASAMLAGPEMVMLCGDISTCIAAAWAESLGR